MASRLSHRFNRKKRLPRRRLGLIRLKLTEGGFILYVESLELGPLARLEQIKYALRSDYTVSRETLLTIIHKMGVSFPAEQRVLEKFRYHVVLKGSVRISKFFDMKRRRCGYEGTVETLNPGRHYGSVVHLN